MNIIITSAGRRVSLVKYFKKELKRSFSKGQVLTTDLRPGLSSACLSSDESFKVSAYSNPNYMTSLMDLCVSRNVKLIIPTIDTGLQLLANYKLFLKEKDIVPIISAPEFVKICRNKRLTNEFFVANGFKIPKAIDKNNPTFPLFIKPIDGSSSQDLYLIDHPSQLSDFLLKQDNLIWMEYMSNDEYVEYTVDLYYDMAGFLKCCVPRIRIAVRGGETNKGVTQKNPVLINFIRDRLGHIEGARGCLTLQLFVSKSQETDIYGIEINPRFGGGYPLSYLAGAKFPKWIIDEYLLGKKLDYFDDWKDNLLLLRYDTEMIIDDHSYKG